MPCLWIKRLDFKVPILPKLIYGFNAIPIKILAGCLVETQNLLLKVMWKCKRPTIAKRILKNKETEDLYYLILRFTIQL